MPQIVSVCTTTCRSRVFWQSLLSFKTQHIRAKPGRRCVGRPASEARPGGHTPRPMAEHGCAESRTMYCQIARKKSQMWGDKSLSVSRLHGGTSLSVMQSPSDDLACARGSRSGTSLRAARVRREESAGKCGQRVTETEGAEVEKALWAENSNSESAKKFQ